MKKYFIASIFLFTSIATLSNEVLYALALASELQPISPTEHAVEIPVRVFPSKIERECNRRPISKMQLSK